jgi:S-adenosylmethionine:tRNA ribosyltransferase-isomerase
MQLADFDYILPPERIAQTATEPRDASRLLVIHKETGDLEHRIFRDLPAYLRPGDTLVLNQTRVIPARLHGIKIPSGGAIEILLLERRSETRWLAMIGGRNMHVGSQMAIPDSPVTAEIVEMAEESRRVIEFNCPIEPYLDTLGELPLPPYIHTPLSDRERYQTVYSHIPGSVAAPTAGLHFTPDLLVQIRNMGVKIEFCTLHVGLGTFLPVREDQIEHHRLHAEYAELTPEAARSINDTKLSGGRVIAVGTTSVRTLETAALRALGLFDPQEPITGLVSEAEACPWKPIVAIHEPTELFIMPGFKFRIVDAMVTNFHLPKSTLLMLVSAFAGRELMLHAYDVAIANEYRFYSLGDACFLTA